MGPAIVATDRVVCDVSGGCLAAKASSVTVTETFTVTGGISSDPITATTAFTWSKAVAFTDTYTFNLANGDDGHIEFLPNVNQICGDLTTYGYVCCDYAGLAGITNEYQLTVIVSTQVYTYWYCSVLP